MAFAQEILKKLDAGIDDALDDTANRLLDHLNEQATGKCQIEAHFKGLFKDD